MEAAIEAARNFRDEIMEDIAALEALDAAMAGTAFSTGGLENQAGAARDTRDAFQVLDDILGEYEGMQARAAEATRESADAGMDAAEVERLLADATRAREDAERSVAVADDILTKSTYGLADAAKASSAAAQGGYGWWGLLTREFTLWGGVFGSANMIGKVAAWHIALDGVFEAAVALTEGLAALTVGLVAMEPAAQDIGDHLRAVSDVSKALGVTIPPLTGKLQALGQAMAPQTVEAYGGALNLVNSGGHTLAQVAQEVVTGLDDWIAKLDIWKQSQAGTGKFLQDGVGFLHQFEIAVDDVGVAVSHLLQADPGTAHFLMDFVDLGAKALDVITEIPAPVLEAALALHSFMLWGGLAATGVLNLLSPLRSVALGMGDVAKADIALTASASEAGGMTALKATIADIGAGFASYGRNIGTAVTEAEGLSKASAGLEAVLGGVSLATAGVTVGAAAAAAGIGYLVVQMMQVPAAAQKIDQATQSLMSGSTSNFMANWAATSAQAMSAISVAMHAQERDWVPYEIAISSSLHNAGTSLGDFLRGDVIGGFKAAATAATEGGKAIGDAITGSVGGQNQQNAINHLNSDLNQLVGGMGRVLQETGNLVKGGYSVSQSWALMDLAGVQASDSFALMKAKVGNLITGYENLSVSGPALSNAVSAVTFASEQQDSKITALTQAWTTFISTVTGGASSFTSFAQQVEGTFAAAAQGGATLSDSNGKVSASTQGLTAAANSATVSMTGLSTGSLQLQSSFTQSVTSASALYNSLLTMASAAGLGQHGVNLLSQASKDMVAQLAPLAKGSQTATAELYALAEQGGYKGADSLQALTAWAGNGKNAMKDLDNITAILTKDSANLTTDVQNLANAIGQDLNGAMSTAILQASGGEKAIDGFAQAVFNAHGNAEGLREAGLNLATSLIKVYGDTNTAHQEFDTLALSMHLSKSQADALWNSIEAGAAAAASATGSHTSQIIADLNRIPSVKNIEFVITTVGSTGVVASPVKAAASGWHVPGYGGGDSVPAMLEPGEAVVPKHLVPAISPFLGAHHVPGFADGGYLPVGLSMGYNRVGGAPSAGGGMGSPQPLHVHVNLEGREMAYALVPDLTAAINDYGYMNSGRPTGKLIPG